MGNVVGVGNIRSRMHDDVVKTFARVKYVQELKKNLIFLSALNLAEYCLFQKVEKAVRVALVK